MFLITINTITLIQCVQVYVGKMLASFSHSITKHKYGINL